MKVTDETTRAINRAIEVSLLNDHDSPYKWSAEWYSHQLEITVAVDPTMMEDAENNLDRFRNALHKARTEELKRGFGVALETL